MSTRIEADRLIPGHGEPLRNGLVVFDGPTIRYAGPVEGGPAAAPSDRTVSVPTVLPGLWDCHVHFLGVRHPDPEEQMRTPVPVQVARAAWDARKALEAGFTSVREAGGYGVFLARAIAEGSLPGPHVYASGTMLSPTAGHGDLHGFPLESVRAFNEALGFTNPCDGPAECQRAVRRVLRLDAQVVKLCATGGVLSDVDDPAHPQFAPEELRAIVEEARRAQRAVMAHAHGKAGILAALEAGVLTIEHGSYLDDEAAEAMLAREAILVPTRFIIDRLVRQGPGPGLPEHMHAKAVALAGRHREAMRLAVRRGVPIALGTDIFGSTAESGAPWGAHAEELRRLVEEAGMSPLAAIESATAMGPRTLGPRAPRSGVLQEGYAADLIAVRGDPSRSVELLGRPEEILAVWKSGTRVAGQHPM